MAIIKTTLGKNLDTMGVLVDSAARVKTAFVDPRNDMNPGELLCAALGACMMTKLGFVASKRGEDVSGTEVTVEPSFDEKHTRVTGIKIEFKFPELFKDERKAFYAQAAQDCPVHNSLREDIAFNVSVK
ncbi:MAG: OsmC family protein [Candidatus Avelusimicrobium sp.]|uniref:OsmC family protein n=1 Tax=Candidatus Avelusimicrobium sp. TaxID=3048833 RepID=UPI003F105FFA